MKSPDHTTPHPAAGPSESPIVLPEAYRILPTSVPFYVPGFERQRYPQAFVLTPEPVECGAWFEGFADRVLRAVGASYLPVCRMSDGEFLLLFGFQPPCLRYPFSRRLKIRLSQVRGIVGQRLRGFRFQTAPGISSGAMSYAERQQVVPRLASCYAEIAREGVLALHLSYGNTPFQEHYFPALGKWLTAHDIRVTLDNYAPFYFVYALLRGPVFSTLLSGRRVLIVHSATGEKREAIVRSVREAHPHSVEWLGISAARSFADKLDLSRLQDKPDICLIGGGVGKSALFPQLRPLSIPCIDAGFAFEVWVDPEKQWDRPYMSADAFFDPARVQFRTPAERRQT